jgi:hypothetical protein
MRSTLTLFAIAIIIILFSCRRDAIDSPKPQADPKLKRTVTKDAAGKIIHTTNYNGLGSAITDTGFSNGIHWVWTLNEYNNKGKRTKSTLWSPTFNPSGHHWMDTDEYLDDTLSIISKHYLRDNLTLLTKHFYNASKLLVLDSNYHTAVGATTSTVYTRRFSYDGERRLLTTTRVAANSDTVTHVTYQYTNSSLHSEVLTTGYSYDPVFSSSSSLVVTDYNTAGKILSEKTYSPVNQLSSQTDNYYDTNGNLVRTVKTSPGNMWETRYTNNSAGKPEKAEAYYQNTATTTTFYYYE